jgi:hypothetical protein
VSDLPRSTHGAASASATAMARLMLSREQLRQVLRPPARGGRDRGGRAEAPGPRGARSSDPSDAKPTANAQARSADRTASPLLAAWLDQLADIPAARIMVAALQVWWDRHPLRLGTRLAADATDALLQPVAQRHPVGLVLGAGLAGAALAWSRPWRWALKPALTPALLAGLLPQLLSQAMRQLPAGTWTRLLASLAQSSGRERPDRDSPPTHQSP